MILLKKKNTDYTDFHRLFYVKSLESKSHEPRIYNNCFVKIRELVAKKNAVTLSLQRKMRKDKHRLHRFSQITLCEKFGIKKPRIHEFTITVL